MKKEEFIGYLRALEDMVDTKDERKLIKKIIARAQDIDVYPYYYKNWNYPWGPYWYTTTTNANSALLADGQTISSDKITLTGSSDWSVNTLPNGDFEIKK